MRAWRSELGLGARLALAGARGATLLTAVGVALGVGLLLLAASVPAALQHREDRARRPRPLPLRRRRPGGLGVDAADRRRRHRLPRPSRSAAAWCGPRGRRRRARRASAPCPEPARSSSPRPSASCCASATAALLRERLGGRVVGTIGAAGLIGPDELAYYAGSDRLAAGGAIARIEAFGVDGLQRRPLDPVLVLLVVVLFVVTLVPLGVFLATAVRFGGEQRDRRLAALRLVGADRAMARRIAAGETLRRRAAAGSCSARSASRWPGRSWST